MVKTSISAVLMSMVLSQTSFSSEPIEKPNIVFFFVDDLGWMDVGYNGTKYYETPNIDKLASQGMIFNQAYSMPTCAPTRASIMSGQYQPRTGIYAVDAFAGTPSEMRKFKQVASKKELHAEKITYGEILKQAGYNTCHIGKWHLGGDSITLPTNQGFDINVAGCDAGHPESYFAPYKNLQHITESAGDYLEYKLRDTAIAFINNQNSDQPFLLNYWFYAVHAPYNVLNKYVEKFKDKPGEKGRNYTPYAAFVYTVDETIGKIIAKLKEKGLYENTVFVFSSDNGGQLMCTDNSPLRGQKGNVYEGGIRVPTFFTWPGKIKAGTVCNQVVSCVDFLPTFAAIAGVELPSNQSFDGENLLPLLTQNEQLKRKAIFWHLPSSNGRNGVNANLWQPPVSVIRKGDWKLIQHLESDSIELYNIKRDIGETKNVATSNKKLTIKLLTDLKAWQKATNASIPSELNPKFDPASRNWIPANVNKRIEGEAEKRTIIFSQTNTQSSQF